MQLTTPVHIPHQPLFTTSTRFFLIGSCFSDEITTRMRDYGLQVTANPFGTMYNPLSIAACINRLYTPDSVFTESDLVFRDGLWHSFMHHGNFSHADKTIALQRMNDALIAGHKALLEADCIIITLGSAFVWERDGHIVANCHKFPNKEFTHRLLSVEEIVSALTTLSSPHTTSSSPLTNFSSHLTTLSSPSKEAEKVCIFTVSPIRHKGDGLDGNMLSKATLRLAASQLTANPSSPSSPSSPLTISPSPSSPTTEAERTFYFPSFEIFMDELRDYRWYASDMLHPSSQAVDYIWERFMETYFSPAEQDQLRVLHQSVLASRHRHLHN